eukprot:CAMPEP_0206255744 /NCGR_PEP_ID=MMETSP0047_2-20121206/24403_1 /ASSEMBLY_ACC=CAM_ASM_000192 /TAXON_ID=195065 /ORGANISM="Chroomonas mesostigmatica_cf, Strain CCMP1168" /LENGTH=121 /DNA_ID=CAMNT_0053682149 /DNA_START=329 /DNA_END=694 /DNA_ORIENTATION=+
MTKAFIPCMLDSKTMSMQMMWKECLQSPPSMNPLGFVMTESGQAHKGVNSALQAVHAPHYWKILRFLRQYRVTWRLHSPPPWCPLRPSDVGMALGRSLIAPCCSKLVAALPAEQLGAARGW